MSLSVLRGDNDELRLLAKTMNCEAFRSTYAWERSLVDDHPENEGYGLLDSAKQQSVLLYSGTDHTNKELE